MIEMINIKEVVREIEFLKTELTVEEKGKLNFYTLKPLSEKHCIYGQATGNCESPRAIDLKEKGKIKLNRVNYSQLEEFIWPSSSNCIYNEDILNYIKGDLDKLPELKLAE